MTRAILILTALTLFAGCTAYNHIQSQQRLTDGVAALQAAERKTQEDIRKTSDRDAFTADPGSYNSVESLRIALANDARADIRAARTTFGQADAADRVSTLSRAAIKAWLAGAPGSDAVEEAKAIGTRLCADPSVAPQRDCAVLSAAEDLNTLEIEADILLPYQALARDSRLPGLSDPADAVQVLAQATTRIAMKLPALQTSEFQGSTGVKRWIGRQRAIYLCHGVSGERALFALHKKVAKTSTEARARLVGTCELGGRGPLTDALVAFHVDFPGVIAFGCVSGSPRPRISAAARSCASLFGTDYQLR